jgi:tRNA threonylcarbamoyladenosine biosynthesis protein TsaE
MAGPSPSVVGLGSGAAPRSSGGPDRVVVVPDAPAMQALGAARAAVAEPGDVVCLYGDLGAGKTQFAKGFGTGLGVTDTVTSPSFVLMGEYAGRLPLFHIDLYRLADGATAIAGGLLDEREADGVTLIEWAERLGGSLPAHRLDVQIDGTGDDPRTVRLVPSDARHARLLEALP